MYDQELSASLSDVPAAPPLVLSAEVASRLAALPEGTRASVFVLVAEIAARLRGPCAYLDNESFARLVLSIAETTLRLHAIDARVLPR